MLEAGDEPNRNEVADMNRDLFWVVGAVITLVFPSDAMAAERVTTSLDGALIATVYEQGEAFALDGVLERERGEELVVKAQLAVAAGSFSGSMTVYDATGSVTGAVTFLTEAQPDGRLRSTSTFRAGSGTGRLARPSGSVRFEGTTDPATGATESSSSGSVRSRPAAARRPAPRNHPYDAHITAHGIAVENGIGRFVGRVSGWTGRPGVIAFTARQGTVTAQVRWRYHDGLGQIRGITGIRREPQPDGTILVRTDATSITAGRGRYRGVRLVRRRASEPGARDPLTGAITLNFAGVLRY